MFALIRSVIVCFVAVVVKSMASSKKVGDDTAVTSGGGSKDVVKKTRVMFMDGLKEIRQGIENLSSKFGEDSKSKDDSGGVTVQTSKLSQAFDAFSKVVKRMGQVRDDSGLNIRKNINSMTAAEQLRYANAVNTMMESVDGVAGSSEFFRVASYHDLPFAPGRDVPYCAHSIESFPVWHRFYMIEYEKALQAADTKYREANNLPVSDDDKITLPYWDWTEDGATFPQIVLSQLNSLPEDMFPSDYAPDAGDAQYWHEGVLIRGAEADINKALENAKSRSESGITTAISNALDGSITHLFYSTTGNGDPPHPQSVEHPHNNVHVVIGEPNFFNHDGSFIYGNMGYNQFAAFDPVFFMHHCNIDRLYEQYLRENPAAEEQMRLQGIEDQANGGTNLYTAPMEPFYKDQETGEFYTASDSFNSEQLGFGYDKLFEDQVIQAKMDSGLQNIFMSVDRLTNKANIGVVKMINEPKFYAIIPNIKVSEVLGGTYVFYVFVFGKKSKNFQEFVAPAQLNQVNTSSVNFGSTSLIFSKGKDCATCANQPAFDLTIDITKTMRNLNLSVEDAVLEIFVASPQLANKDGFARLKDTNLPAAYIAGSLFGGSKDINKQAIKGLKEFNLHPENVDNAYDKATFEKSVKLFQKSTGVLEVNGKMDSNSQAVLTSKKRCLNKDYMFEEKEQSKNTINIINNIMSNDKSKRYIVHYVVGFNPSNVKRDNVLKCVLNAFNVWNTGISDKNLITFARLPNYYKDKNKADIIIRFSHNRGFLANKHSLFFDGTGRGGKLARTFVNPDNKDQCIIELDRRERWSTEISPNEIKNDEISLFATLLHQIGHVLGLSHSIDHKNVMSPYYDANKTQLTQNDIDAVKNVIKDQQ